jgi:hypothetical protein
MKIKKDGIIKILTVKYFFNKKYLKKLKKYQLQNILNLMFDIDLQYNNLKY